MEASSDPDQGDRSSEEKAFIISPTVTTYEESRSTTLADETMKKATFPDTAFWEASTLPAPSVIAEEKVTPDFLAAWQLRQSKPQTFLKQAGGKSNFVDQSDVLGKTSLQSGVIGDAVLKPLDKETINHSWGFMDQKI